MSRGLPARQDGNLHEAAELLKATSANGAPRPASASPEPPLPLLPTHDRRRLPGEAARAPGESARPGTPSRTEPRTLRPSGLWAARGNLPRGEPKPQGPRRGRKEMPRSRSYRCFSWSPDDQRPRSGLEQPTPRSGDAPRAKQGCHAHAAAAAAVGLGAPRPGGPKQPAPRSANTPGAEEKRPATAALPPQERGWREKTFPIPISPATEKRSFGPREDLLRGAPVLRRPKRDTPIPPTFPPPLQPPPPSRREEKGRRRSLSPSPPKRERRGTPGREEVPAPPLPSSPLPSHGGGGVRWCAS